MTDQIRRAWCLGWAALLLALPMAAASLSYTGLTETSTYSPGTQSFDSELDPATRNDVLKITRNIFGPDEFHVAFLSGEADFGRLTSAALVSASPVLSSNAGFFSSLSPSFHDTLTIQGPSSGFLSLELSMDGVLAQSGGNGDSATGQFSILTTDPLGTTTNSGGLCMFWEGSSAPGYCAPLLVGVLAPLKAAMTITPDGLGGAIYHGQATILLPFTTSSFDLHVRLTTQVRCDAPCSAKADFGHTSLVGGYQILDSSGNVNPGATLTSVSGYDYITPPGPAAASGVPEPGSVVLSAAIFGILLWRRRSLRAARV